MTITLVGKDIATEGMEFYSFPQPEECGSCKLRNVCNNLEEGARYRIAEVRKQEHDCPLLEDEKIVAVDVVKVPTPAILPKKGLLEGVTVTFAESKCDNMGCGNWSLCHPTGKIEGKKYTVVRMSGAECPKGDKVAFVELI